MGALVESLEDIQESVAAISSTLEGRGIEMSGVPFSGYAAAISGLSQVEVHGNTISQVGGDTFTGASHTKADIDGILQNGSQAAGQAYYRDGTWREAAISGSTVLLGGTFKFIPYVSGRDIHYNATQYISVPEATATAIAYSGDTHTTEDDVQGALDDLFQVSELIDDMAAGGSATAGRLTGMDLYVRQSQSLQGVQVTQAPNMVLAAGAVASAVTAGSGASIYVMPGATATDVTAAGGQVLDSSNVTSYGAVYTATRVFTAGHVDLGCTADYPAVVTYRGGTSYYLTAKGQAVNVSSGGLVSGLVQRRGTLQVYSGGVAAGCVMEAGAMVVSSGGTYTGNTNLMNAASLIVSVNQSVCVSGNTFACGVTMQSNAAGVNGNTHVYATFQIGANCTVSDIRLEEVARLNVGAAAGTTPSTASGIVMSGVPSLYVYGKGSAYGLRTESNHSGYIYMYPSGYLSGFHDSGFYTRLILSGGTLVDWHMNEGEITLYKTYGVLSGVSSALTRFMLASAAGNVGAFCSDCVGGRLYAHISASAFGGTFSQLESAWAGAVVSGVNFNCLSANCALVQSSFISGCTFTRSTEGTALLTITNRAHCSGNTYKGKVRAMYGNHGLPLAGITNESFTDGSELFVYNPSTVTGASLAGGCKAYLSWVSSAPQSAATVVGCTMRDGSFMYISAKAVASSVSLSGSTQNVMLSGAAVDTGLVDGSLQMVNSFASALRTTAGSGGSVTVINGGTVTSADILSGGSLLVSSRGVALDVYSAAGATVTSMAGATITYRSVR